MQRRQQQKSIEAKLGSCVITGSMALDSNNSSDATGSLFRIWICLCCLIFLAACNRMITPQNKRLVQDGDAKAAEGKFMNAVALYESALDGTAQSADVHYRLALLYDDKMNDPLNALHHFKRYLALAPDGTHAIDAKNFMKRDELALLTNLSGD